MKRSLLLLFGLLIAFGSSGQDWLQQYFDGEDTIPELTLPILIDTSGATNVWQIGPPQKTLFNSASTVPNVLITDTINPYPINDTSSFELVFSEDFLMWGGSILAIQWNQKLDLDSANDLGMLEFTLDSGDTWQNAFDNPLTYNYYGFDLANITTTGDTMAFSGTDTIWRDVWLCFDLHGTVRSYAF